VDISVTVCFFVRVCVSVRTVTDFSAEDKVSDVKFCTAFLRRPRQGISHFGELCSPRSPKSDESAWPACLPIRPMEMRRSWYRPIARRVDVGFLPKIIKIGSYDVKGEAFLRQCIFHQMMKLIFVS